MTDTTFF